MNNNINLYTSYISKYQIIFILGNSEDIENIDLSIMNNYGLTCGINRMYLKSANIDYLFFLDNIILTEIIKNNIDVSSVGLITSGYNNNIRYNQNTLRNKKFKHIISQFSQHTHIDQDVTSLNIFGSISSLIYILEKFIFTQSLNLYVICGSPLNPKAGHFWKNDKYNNYKFYNTHNNKWYQTRFNYMSKSLSYLVYHHNINIINTSPNSQINKNYIPYIELNNLYDHIHRYR